MPLNDWCCRFYVFFLYLVSLSLNSCRVSYSVQVLPVLCREHHLIGALAALLRTHAAHAEVLDLVLLIIGNVAAGADAETLFALVYAGAIVVVLVCSDSFGTINANLCTQCTLPLPHFNPPGTLPYIDDAGAKHVTNAALQQSILAVIGNVLARAHLLNNDQRFETERACCNCVLNVMAALPGDAHVVMPCLKLIMRLVQDERVSRYLCTAGAAPRLLALLPYHGGDVELRQAILRTLSELTNTTTAPALLDAGVLATCLDIVGNEVCACAYLCAVLAVLNLA
jgi:hypothetical protein